MASLLKDGNKYQLRASAFYRGRRDKYTLEKSGGESTEKRGIALNFSLNLEQVKLEDNFQ